MQATRDVDLTACDRDPIRIPGSVQPHGVLFVLDPAGGVLQASANAGRVLADSEIEPQGRPMREVLAPGAEGVLDALVQEGKTLPALGAVRLNGRTLSPQAHQSDGCVILELEEAAGAAESLDQLFQQIRASSRRSRRRRPSRT